MKPTNTCRSHSQKDVTSKTNFTQHNPPMTEQLIAPPARVWDKIEKILDEQDRNRFAASKLENHKTKNPVPIFAAAVASIVAGFVWLTR